MKKLLMSFVLFALLIGQVTATSNVDNNLEPLFTAKKVNWGVQIDGMYPESHTDYIYLSESRSSGSLSFTISKPDKVTQAFLYVFTKGFDCLTCEKWTVRFNDNTLVSRVHSDSVGPNPRGDGELTKEKQTIRFPVSDSDINDGSNLIEFIGTQFFLDDRILIRGAVLVTFYETPNEHEIWVFDGVEYLNHKLVPDDYFYAIDLISSTYPPGSTAMLTTVYHNKEIPEDALYFNDVLLEDANATYLFGTQNSSFLTAKQFDVSNYLDQSDLVNFTYLYHTPPGLTPRIYTGDYPLYPSLVILDVDIQDTTPPSVNFTSPANNTAIAGDKTAGINFTVDDPDATIDLQIDGSSVSPSEISAGVWTYIWNLTAVSMGRHNLTAYATDSSGNTGSDTLFLNVTKPAPVVSFIFPTNGTLLPQKFIVTIQVSVDDPNATVSIEIDGVEVSNTSTYIWDPSSVEAGIHLLSATATDALNHVGRETVTVNVTAEDVTTTTTTISNGETTTTTTLPPTTPPLPKVELAINSLTLSTGSSTIKKGTDVTVYILASNSGGSSVDATIALYIDDELIESKTSSLKAYETEERTIYIREGRLSPGSHTMRAKIIVQGGSVEERDLTDNERSLEIFVEEKSGALDAVKPYLKWLAVVVALIILAKVIITFIMQREEDYLR